MKLTRALLISLFLHAAILSRLQDSSGGGGSIGKLAPSHPVSVVIRANPLPATSTSEAIVIPQASKQAGEITAQRTDGSPTAKLEKQPGEPLVFGLNTFFPIEALDRKPRVVIDIPADPPELQEYQGPASAIVELWISKEGHVVRAIVDSATGAKAFKNFVGKAFYGARFRPGMLGRTPVAAKMYVIVTFHPASGIAVVERSNFSEEDKINDRGTIPQGISRPAQ